MTEITSHVPNLIPQELNNSVPEHGGTCLLGAIVPVKGIMKFLQGTNGQIARIYTNTIRNTDNSHEFPITGESH